jgi:hypothetical protein
MKKLALCCLTFASTVAMMNAGNTAQPDCAQYRVSAPILDVRKDPTQSGGYIDVLERGNIVCVAREQKVGSRTWGYVSHKVLADKTKKPVNGWVGLRFMKPQADAPTTNNAASTTTQPTKPDKTAPASGTTVAGLQFNQPVPFGPFAIRGKTLKELANATPMFSPVEGLDENLWKKKCTTCHKWNRTRLCDQGTSYIQSAAIVFRHQHPYGGPYKLALMRWAKSGCK